MLSLVTVSPVITAFHSCCCLSHHVVRRSNKGNIKMRTKVRNKKINSQIKKPYLKNIPNKDNYNICTNPTMEDLIRRTNNWIYKTKKSKLDRSSGPVPKRIETLSLYGSRWALSEDSGFNSYPSRPEVYLVKNVVRYTTTMEGSNYWGYGYKTPARQTATFNAWTFLSCNVNIRKYFRSVGKEKTPLREKKVWKGKQMNVSA